mmetsp:Transcript_31677/g.80395  ORF Transcript_31677/g.80395 Transcript_31677/m.80395 type:complete len:222 (+) Transcript_31677:352-1017(+)
MYGQFAGGAAKTPVTVLGNPFFATTPLKNCVATSALTTCSGNPPVAAFNCSTVFLIQPPMKVSKPSVDSEFFEKELLAVLRAKFTASNNLVRCGFCSLTIWTHSQRTVSDCFSSKARSHASCAVFSKCDMFANFGKRSRRAAVKGTVKSTSASQSLSPRAVKMEPKAMSAKSLANWMKDLLATSNDLPAFVKYVHTLNFSLSNSSACSRCDMGFSASAIAS